MEIYNDPYWILCFLKHDQEQSSVFRITESKSQECMRYSETQPNIVFLNGTSRHTLNLQIGVVRDASSLPFLLHRPHSAIEH